eukprot:COSAG02_NODE_1219_length_13812_cov_108.713629_3_plen_176_part_00
MPYEAFACGAIFDNCPLKIESLAVWGKKLLIGTHEGVLLIMGPQQGEVSALVFPDTRRRAVPVRAALCVWLSPLAWRCRSDCCAVLGLLAVRRGRRRGIPPAEVPNCGDAEGLLEETNHAAARVGQPRWRADGGQSDGHHYAASAAEFRAGRLAAEDEGVQPLLPVEHQPVHSTG